MSEEKIKELQELLNKASESGLKEEDVLAVGKLICYESMFGDAITIVNKDTGWTVEVCA